MLSGIVIHMFIYAAAETLLEQPLYLWIRTRPEMKKMETARQVVPAASIALPLSIPQVQDDPTEKHP